MKKQEYDNYKYSKKQYNNYRNNDYYYNSNYNDYPYYKDNYNYNDYSQEQYHNYNYSNYYAYQNHKVPKKHYYNTSNNYNKVVIKENDEKNTDNSSNISKKFSNFNKLKVLSTNDAQDKETTKTSHVTEVNPNKNIKNNSHKIYDMDFTTKVNKNSSYKYWEDKITNKKYYVELLKKDDLEDLDNKNSNSIYSTGNNIKNQVNIEKNVNSYNKNETNKSNNIKTNINSNINSNAYNSTYNMQVPLTKEEFIQQQIISQKLLYRSEQYILKKYPQLFSLVSPPICLKQQLTQNHSNIYFIIKAFSEEDIHKSIKYSIWSSNSNGNTTLSNAFKQSVLSNCNVYLFFSGNGSGRFAGIARLTSDVNINKNFPFWSQDNKWSGFFKIQWLMLKDIPFKNIKHIKFLMKDGIEKSIIFSRDVQEVPYTEACSFLDVLFNFSYTNSLLEHFEFYDIRQEGYAKDNKLNLEFDCDN